MADGLSRCSDLLATLQVTELLTGVMTRIAAAYPEDPWIHDPANREGLVMREGLWYRDQTVVVPNDVQMRRAILRELHDRGIEKTLEKVKRLFGGRTSL